MAFIVPFAPLSFRAPPTRTPLRRPPPSSHPARTRRAVPHCTDGTTVDPDSRLQLWREVEALRKSLTIAVNAERFSDAARIRDEIETLRLSDDYVRTETDLQRAVEEQRFADAAQLRDALKALDPPPSVAALGARDSNDVTRDGPSSRKWMADMEPSDVDHWSLTDTEGIVVRAESYYVQEQSIPSEDRYQFGYKIRITNQTSDTCQLVSRHWIINSSVGAESEVKGPGVVGRQPVLEPGDSFEYTSSCPITAPLKDGQTIVGNMRGQFQFCKGDTGNVKFSAEVDTFYFKIPSAEM